MCDVEPSGRTDAYVGRGGQPDRDGIGHPLHQRALWPRFIDQVARGVDGRRRGAYGCGCGVEDEAHKLAAVGCIVGLGFRP